jgi:hypothetical protein
VSVSTVLYPKWLPLLKIEISSNGIEDVVLNIEHMEVHVGEKWKALIKLRKQFGHATYDRLAQLMNNAGNTKCTDVASLEILRTICENQQKFKVKKK